MSDSTALRAVSAPVAAVDGAQLEIAALARDVIDEAERAGVELPDGFAVQLARTIGNRSRRPLLALGWAMYRAGVDRAVADTVHDEPTSKVSSPR